MPLFTACPWDVRRTGELIRKEGRGVLVTMHFNGQYNLRKVIFQKMEDINVLYQKTRFYADKDFL